MVKKVSGSSKIKMCVVMCLVFAFSFLLTVNAFADYSVHNDHYFGAYKSNRSEVGLINVSQVHVRFNTYLHVFYPSSGGNPGHSELITGLSEEGKLDSYGYRFRIPTYNIVDNNGVYHGSEGIDATVSGTTEVKMGGKWQNGFISTITLTPTYLTTVKYTLTK